MALIKCNECLGQISDKALVCPHCGNPMIQQELNNENIEQINYQNQEELNNENKQEETEENQQENNEENQQETTNQTNYDLEKTKNSKKTVITILIIIIFLIIVVVNLINEKEKNNKIIEENLKQQQEEKEEKEKNCKEFTDRLQTFVDNKDYQGFEHNWDIHEDLSAPGCKNIVCACPKATDLRTKIDLLEAEEYYQKGDISNSFRVLDMSIGHDNEIKEFHDTHHLFKLLPTKEKEEITGIRSTFGEWGINIQEGGDIDFNKRYVNITSTYLYMNFSTYDNKVLISGHLASKKHPYWNDEENCCAVEHFNYRIIDNKIELKRENEKEYDAMFEIISLTDTELKLKLLISTTDVNKGHIYVMQYK